jgi:hypothetical protein
VVEVTLNGRQRGKFLKVMRGPPALTKKKTAAEVLLLAGQEAKPSADEALSK